VALMISGAFVAVLVCRYGSRQLRDETATAADWRLPRVWHALIRWAIPGQAIVLLVWWGWQATTPGFLGEGGRWYDPLNPYSLMTCLAQWGVVLAALVLLNGWMWRGVRGGPEPPDPAGGLASPHGHGLPPSP
jgi:NSS family neurotransmitter:Na+ symporter